jgi:hypothetical protein
VSPEPETTHVDPPYQALASHYAGAPLDYGLLGVWCRCRAGLVIVCEGVDAKWLPFQPVESLRAIRNGAKERNNFEGVWWKDDF